MDENSGRFITNIDWAVGDHTQLFAIGSVNAGGGDSEFDAIFDYYIILGLEYTF